MDIEAARKIAWAIATPYARRFFVDVDDARQVAWIAAWRAISTYDAARAKITTWIDRCVRLALADWRRNSSEWGDGSPVVGCVRGLMKPIRNGLSGGGQLLDRGFRPGWKFVDDADEAAAICRRAFRGDLLRRRYLCGESVVDIAASMGLHPTRIDQILREAIAKARASAG